MLEQAITILIWIIWMILINLILGYSILLLFYGDLKSKFCQLEIITYSLSLGTAYIAVLGFILDWTFGVNIINVIIPIAITISISLIVRRKYVSNQFRIGIISRNIRGFLPIIFVAAYGLIVRVIVPYFNEILIAYDPWYWLDISKNVAYTGHSLAGFKPLYPSGFAYITSILCLTDPDIIYLFLQIISVCFYFVIGCISVICISGRLFKQDKKYGLFAGLVFASSYLLVAFGMLGVPQNVAYALIPSSLLFLSQRGIQRISGFLLAAGIYVIHAPSTLLILISLGILALFYLISHKGAIHLKETKIILITLTILIITVIFLIPISLPSVINYFITFTYTDGGNPGLIKYLFYSAGILTIIFTVLGGFYSIKEKQTLINLFFILFIVSIIFTQLPAGSLGIPWPPIRYLMYMSVASTIPASYGMSKAVEIIKRYNKYNTKFYVSAFLIGTIIFQSSIGLTALVKTGGWDYAINPEEYISLLRLSEISNHSDRILVYPSIFRPAKAFLNPTMVSTNSTHIFNETAVNSTIISELLASSFNYILLNAAKYPLLYTLLSNNSAFLLEYSSSYIRVFRF